MVRPWCPHLVRWYPRLLGAFFFGSWILKAAESLLAPTWSLVDGHGWKPVYSLSRLSSPLCRRCRAPRIRVLRMAGGRGSGRSGGRGRGRGQGPGSPASDAFRLGEEERLQKFLSHAGLESRRQCEQMILDGRVRVNGKVVKELGVKVDPRRDQVRVDGDRVSMRPQSEVKWVAINKPKGVICTLSDELGRPTAVDVVPRGRELRLVPVGRLDRDSCGLLLMTNENSWVNPLTHPSYGHEKTYRVSITSGYPNEEEWDTLTQGMLLDGDPNPTRPCIVEIVDFDRRTLVTTVNVIIKEGKNRQIRRMFEGIGHDVKSITRIAHGPIRLKGLRPGEWRSLEEWEVDKLKNLTTKTLKSPQRLSPSTRDQIGTNIAHRSSRASIHHGATTAPVKSFLDQEEEEWNRGGAWDRRAIVKSGATESDDQEWHTTSWARENEERNRGVGKGGRNRRKMGNVGRKARMTEADRILEKLKKGGGDVIKPPAWEGGGRVEREGRAVAGGGKGSWTPSRG